MVDFKITGERLFNVCSGRDQDGDTVITGLSFDQLSEKVKEDWEIKARKLNKRSLFQELKEAIKED